MTLILVSLLFLLVHFAHSERLPNHRRSCVYGKVYIESSTPQNVHVTFSTPEAWKEIVEDECNQFKKANRTRRALRTKLPILPAYRGFSPEDKDKKITPTNSTEIRKVIRHLLYDEVAHSSILNMVNDQVRQQIQNHTEPYYRLGSEIPDSRCVKNVRQPKFPLFADPELVTDIALKIELLLSDELEAWKCQDIGQVSNGSYQFYEMTKDWMAEREDGKDIWINLANCRQMSPIRFFCPSSAFKNVFECSVNNVENCILRKEKPKSQHRSYARMLPDGIALFGTFQTMTSFIANATEPIKFGVDPGLSYFSFKDTEMAKSNLEVTGW